MLNVGFNNFVSREKIIAIVSSESKPIKRLLEEARKEFKVIDATSGKKTRTVIILPGYFVLSSLHPQTLAQRVSQKKEQAWEKIS